MDENKAEIARATGIINIIAETYSKRVVGQAKLRETLLIALLSEGHVLLESVPGLAKTTAAATIASTVHGEFSRIQCTPDLLPSDIIGTEIYNQKTGDFRTQLGPVHANFVLLDEINRSSAKTQSAMLESMQERQTSIGGVMHKLPSPFMVIATQNPIEQEGTYHLPEAQLDRFMMKDVLEYSSPEEELEILRRIDTGALSGNPIDDGAKVSLDDVRFLQEATKNIYVDEQIRSYIINIVYATRNPAKFLPAEVARYVEYGASPRASIAFLTATRALALLNGRPNVIPEDVKVVAERVLRHRVVLKFDAYVHNVTSESVIKTLLDVIPCP